MQQVTSFAEKLLRRGISLVNRVRKSNMLFR